MAREREQRRLAAILAADVVGYSRLMEADETGTLERLKELRRALFAPTTAEFGGRIFKITGDGALAEFASSVHAVNSAIQIQRALAERNSALPENRRLDLRIGISLGDVIVEGDDLYGNGVNIAARLETLAEPGGICISESVYEHVRNMADAAFEDLGEQAVKNIERPVRVYRLTPPDAGKSPRLGKTAALALPDRPSIAIMPFDNMSGDAEQAYFSEGITEDIITELSRFHDLFVIARNSSFAFKGRNMTVQEVARELGVHYVLEGSVRRADNRVRVTAQLIDGASGAHLWANRFDREITDIFEIQDDITCTVAATVSGRAKADFAHRVFTKPPESMAAYDYVMAARVMHHRGGRDDNAEAQRLIDRAIEADPNFAVAHAWKCCILGQAWERGFEDRAQLYPIAAEALQKAIALDPNDLEANRVLCETYMIEKRLDDAWRHNDRAYSINPNDPRIVAQRGELLTWLGRPEEGAEWVRTAMRLDPYETHSRAHLLGRALLVQGRYRDAAEAYAANSQPRWSRRAELAAALALAGDEEASKAQAAEVLHQRPTFQATAYAAALSFAHAEDRERLREGLTKAGLPD